MNLLKRVSGLLIICFFLMGCEFGNYLLINDNGNQENISFQCGELSMSAMEVAINHFFIDISYTLVEEVVFYPDSLQIQYGDHFLPFNISVTSKNNEESKLIIRDRGEISIQFSIEGGIGKGDTILIKDNGYLYCYKVGVNVGSIYLIRK